MRTPFLAIFRLCFLEGMQYRAAAVSGALTQLAFGMLYIWLYRAFYASSSAPMPMSLLETVTYLWLVQALLLLVPWRGDPVITDSILTGAVARELLRPCGIYGLWFARVLGHRLAAISLRALPVLGVAWLLFPLRMPHHPLTIVLFAAALVGALLLCASLVNALHVCLFGMVSAEGLQVVFLALTSALSGQLIPLALLPDAVRPLVLALPFAGLLDTPLSIFLERLSPVEAGLRLAHQLLWAGILMWTARSVLARQLHRLVIAGG